MEEVDPIQSSPYTIGFDGSVPVCPKGFDCALVVNPENEILILKISYLSC